MLTKSETDMPIDDGPEQGKILSIERRLADDIRMLIQEGSKAEAEAADAKATAAIKYEEAGRKLIEAKAQVKNFKAFLAEIGLSRSRAYELIAIAEGRVTEEDVRKTTNERKKRHRAKNAAKEPEAAAVSVPEQTTRPSPSEWNLAEFKAAVRTYVPTLDAADLQKAIEFFNEYVAELAPATRH